MYNRYIPQPDGSFRRSRVPDPYYPQQTAPEPDVEEFCPEPEPEYRAQEPRPKQDSQRTEPKQPPCARSKQQQRRMPSQQRGQNHRQKRQEQPKSHSQDRSNPQVNSFLKNLLPKDFETADLLIVLLLLLMAGDCGEDQNSALLTLALYFFM